MLSSYPKQAGNLESSIQLVLLVSLLAFLALYSTIRMTAHEPETVERTAIMMQAIEIIGIAFLLALSASGIRWLIKQPPVALIWAGILSVSLLAWILACLILLSSL